MKERPILFSAQMVRAILEGRKSMTRRVVKLNLSGRIQSAGLQFHPEDRLAVNGCPYGVPGDHLWVKETHSVVYSGFADGKVNDIRYKADDPDYPYGWTPSIFMPRWASRITLEITDVRVERLQEITEEDAINEGLHVQMGEGLGRGPGFKWNGPGYHDYVSRGSWGPTYHVLHGETCCCDEGQRLHLTPAKCAFRILWQSINGKKYPWDSNPWVWVLSFSRI